MKENVKIRSLAEIIRNPEEVHGKIYQTGFKKLDEILGGGLKPGLHFIAGFAASGKSAMVSQMALQMSENGTPVLYFSLEMSEKECVSRMLSFMSHRMFGEKGYSANDYLKIGKYKDWKDEEKRKYQEIVKATEKATENIYLISDYSTSLTVEIIDEVVNEMIEKYNKKPVVLVDCLHMLRVPHDEYLPENQRVQMILQQLSALSDKYTITVLCTTWVSRKMYDQPITLKALKEANYVALYATSILGLQCEGCGGKWFDFTEALRQKPRSIELVILKNKNAMVGQKIKYSFDMKYNTVIEGEVD